MIKKSKIIFILILILVPASIIAQSNKSSELENLESRRAKLQTEKKILKTEVDLLSDKLFNLKEEVRLAFQEIYILKYGKENGVNVSFKRIWKGMTDEMLRDSWGEPDQITKNVENWGVFTQWYYGDVTYFFKDGKLTDWEEKKK